ncbi:MAG: hypothetical protein RL362_1283 [Bacteroidota bacterium]|jgi:hypothetical protein
MTIEIHTYSSPEELRLKSSTLYLIFGYGTGDTFNAMIHLAKAAPLREYELIIKKPQLNLVLFLLGIYQRLPIRIHVVDHWKHDFSVFVAQNSPSISFMRGLEPNLLKEGLIDVWLNPFNYNKVIPLTDLDVIAIQGYFSAQKPKAVLPENSVILFPTAGANFTDYVPPWEKLVKTLKDFGLQHVYVNQSGIADYGNEMISGAEPIALSHEELIRAVYNPIGRMNLVAVRSGVIDILRFSAARALVLYQPIPEGIFETCRFGLLKHNLDLIEVMCLNESKVHQDKLLEYYVQQFIASTLER